ncbi:MAG: hypothetical protein IID37_08645 [Planctomycetes bacterium]|nr:hypothetical protein [Planctomycetota bacterium]
MTCSIPQAVRRGDTYWPLGYGETSAAETVYAQRTGRMEHVDGLGGGGQGG